MALNKSPADIKNRLKKGMTMASKLPSNLPVATVAKRGVKKGTSAPKAKTPRSKGRYIDLKIRLPIEEYNRGLPYFENPKNLVRFILDAVREKINRAEANDKAGRLKKLLTDETLLLPVLNHMQKTGKLNFLSVQEE
jgi:hypothetical protein